MFKTRSSVASKIAVALCLFFILFSAAHSQEDVDHLLDAVVSIKVASNVPNASGHNGTGFVVSATAEDILVVTARHVLFSKDGDPIFDPKGILVTFRADRYNPKPASFLANGPDNLLFSVLKVTKKNAGNLPPSYVSVTITAYRNRRCSRFNRRMDIPKGALRRNPTTCPKGQLSQIGGRWLA